jgi:hypothetical protein
MRRCMLSSFDMICGREALSLVDSYDNDAFVLNDRRELDG